MEESIKSGYVSIDKPQYKYYRSEPIREFEVDQTLYQLVFKANEENMKYFSMGYFGNAWTYKMLKEEVDRVASAYIKLGVKKGDIVSLGVINTPEVAVNLLALNKIGAVSKWLDIRASAEDLEHYLCEHDCKYMIALDSLSPKIESIIGDTDVKKVLTISPSDSLNLFQKLGYKLKLQKEGTYIKPSNDSRFISFQNFSKSGNMNDEIPVASFDKEKPSVIIQSSGTTGMAKSIVHSDYSFTNFVKKIAYSDLPFAPGKTLLVVVPPWIGYGLANSLFLSLGFGMKAELCPKFDPNAVYNYLGKFNFAFAAPFHYRYLADNIDKIKKEDLKHIEALISGGDKITIEELEYLKEILGIGVVNGYGNNEGLGAETFNPCSCNKFGTVGIPKYGDTIISYDNETGKELKYGEVGEVCVQTETMFLEYSNNPEETKRIKKLHDDGKYWIHTGDLGKVDEDGFWSLEGRSQRVIVRLGFKLSPLGMENVVGQHYAVKECMAVAVPDSDEEHVPMMFYTLKDDYLLDKDKIEEEIKQLCKEKLKENMIPKYFTFINEMPYTDNNKYDFRRLEELGNDLIKENKGISLTLVNKKVV